MQLANIVVQRERDNRIFEPGAGPNGGEFFLPWRQLRRAFANAGYELNTPDVNAGRPVAFEFHLNARRSDFADGVPRFAYLYEDPLVRPLNARRDLLARYRKVYTWDETLIDGRHFLPLSYPNNLGVVPVPGWDERGLFCVMVASNKALRYPDRRNLHDRRLAVIRGFERLAPDRFALFGHGWDIPAVRPGASGRIVKRLDEWRLRYGLLAPEPPFPSWRGVVHRKSDVLRQARFAICFENSRGNPGYLTEKIFDCFTSGCVPVYIGTTHARHPIPPDCYIDGDLHADPRELIEALGQVTPERHAQYQAAMVAFLRSPQARLHTDAHWCATLVEGIVQALQASPHPPSNPLWSDVRRAGAGLSSPHAAATVAVPGTRPRGG